MFVSFIFGQNTANVTVNISNIDLSGGKVFIGLYNNEATFKLKSGAVDSIIFIPDKEITRVVFSNIPIGNYAVAAFQDINNNNKLDSREFKIPKEPVGISNYPINKSKLPPIFKKAQFIIITDTLVFVTLQKY